MAYDLEKGYDPEIDEKVPEGYTKDTVQSERIFEQLKSGERDAYGLRMAEDVRLYAGAQFTKEEANSIKSDEFLPLSDYEATACVDQLVAALTSKQPKWTATGRENDDTNDASFVADLMAYIWDISHGNIRLKTAVRDGEVKGMMAMMPYYDPYADNGRGEIFIKEIDPTDLYISPSSSDPLTLDAVHKIIRVVMTGEMIQDQYPEVDLKDAREATDDKPTGSNYSSQETAFGIADTFHKKYEVLDRYSKILIPMLNVWDPYSKQEYNFTEKEYEEFKQRPAVIETTTNSTRYITQEDEVNQQMQIIEQFGEVYHYILNQNKEMEMAPGLEELPTKDGSVENSTYELRVTTCGQLLEEGAIKWIKYKAIRIKRVLSVAGREVQNKIMGKLDTQPIVTMMLNHLGNPYPTSNIRKVKDYIKQLIFFQSMLVKHTSRSTNVTVIIGKGAHDLEDIKKKMSSPSCEVVEVDFELPGAQPIILYPQQLANELFRYIKNLKYDIQRVLGSYEASDGSPEGAHPTKGGLLAQDEMRMRRAEATRKDIEAMLNELGNVVSQMLPEYYTERKAFKISGEHGKKREAVINGVDEDGKIFNDTYDTRYNIQMVSGSMKEVLRWGKLDILMEAWDRQILTVREPILRAMEIDDVELIIEKQDAMAQMQQQIQQMGEHIKKLEGDAQTAERELKTADRMIEKSKFQVDMGGLKGKVEGEVKGMMGRLAGEEKAAKIKINNNGGK